MAEAKKWTGPVPLICDVCQGKIDKVFIDGRTRDGRWGYMCPVCHPVCGVGLGTGRGQRYVQQNDKKTWLKVEG